MEEFAKKKGKELTRGSKLIAKENAETIHFYRNMILGKNKNKKHFTTIESTHKK